VTGPGPGPGGWHAWLDTLGSAARELERRLDAGEAAAFIDLPPLPLTDGALPDHLLEPARALLDQLGALGRRAEAQRDALRQRLAGLAVPRPRGTAAPEYEMGHSLDVAG
jgi:hypothetical protein